MTTFSESQSPEAEQAMFDSCAAQQQYQTYQHQATAS
jgi:hypothetical protein